MNTDKKEVLEYLRNMQKAAEIEAKLYGINIWVLLGAISLITWQLLQFLDVQVVSWREMVVRTILVSNAGYLLVGICKPTGGLRDDLRYQGLRPGELFSPLLSIIQGCVYFVPGAVSIYVIGNSLAGWVLTILGIFVLGMAFNGIFQQVRRDSASNGRFPTPYFRISRRGNVVGELVFGIVLLLSVSTQVTELWHLVSASSEQIKFCALIAALYLLCVIALQRTVSNYALDWTYELETDVVLGIQTPEAALRRIESKSLGPRFEEVMQQFFADLEGMLGQLEKELDLAGDRLAGIEEIPKKFPAERTARIDGALEHSAVLLRKLRSELDELESYMVRLRVGNIDARVLSAIKQIDSERQRVALQVSKLSVRLDSVKAEALARG